MYILWKKCKIILSTGGTSSHGNTDFRNNGWKCEDDFVGSYQKNSRSWIDPCTADDVTLWREKNKYTWHEEVDCKTMKKVPSVIHGNMSHNGGIAKMNNNQKTQLKEVKFDDWVWF